MLAFRSLLCGGDPDVWMREGERERGRDRKEGLREGEGEDSVAWEIF